MWVRLLHFFFGRRWRLLHFFFCASSSATWPSGPTSTFRSFGLLKSCGGATCEWFWGWCPCCCLSVWLQLGFLNGLRAQRAALLFFLMGFVPGAQRAIFFCLTAVGRLKYQLRLSETFVRRLKSIFVLSRASCREVPPASPYEGFVSLQYIIFEYFELENYL